MITIPTTFILGAGASAGYGLPLGSQLVDQIVWAARGARESPVENDLRNLFESDLLYDFAERLQYSALYSIDAFLVQSDIQLVDIGKAAIALLILKGEYECKARHQLFDKAPSDHWLRYVWNAMRSGATRDTISQNNVYFITFNYDRCIEYFFEVALKNAFNLSDLNAVELREKCVRVVHLHGTPTMPFGAYQKNPHRNFAQSLIQGIRVIHDVQGPGADFELAREWIRAAKRICFLGFGYHEVNIQRLRFSACDGKPEVFGCAYGMQRAEMDLASLRIALGGTFDGTRQAENFLRYYMAL